MILNMNISAWLAPKTVITYFYILGVSNPYHTYQL